MPRAKRSLKEADPNAKNAPSSKLSSNGKDVSSAVEQEKENAAPDLNTNADAPPANNVASVLLACDQEKASAVPGTIVKVPSAEVASTLLASTKTVAELQYILKARYLCHTGNKAQLIERLQGDNRSNGLSPTNMSLDRTDESEDEDTQSANANAPSPEGLASTLLAPDHEEENTTPNVNAYANAPSLKDLASTITIAELQKILISRRLPKSGNKSARIERLEWDNFQHCLSLANTSLDRTDQIEHEETRSANVAKGLEWLCDIRPRWAKEPEEEDDDDDDEDDDGDDDEDEGEGEAKEGEEKEKDDFSISVNLDKKEARGTSADEHPEWDWVTSSKGAFLRNYLYQEMMKRDQDVFNMHNFEDWNGHGTIEVMENALIDFDKDFKKKDVTSETLWPHMEGLAWFFHTGMDQMHWAMLGDPQDCCAMVVLLGAALQNTLDVLAKEGKFVAKTGQESQDIPIRNIGLILALWIKFAIELCQEEMCRSGEADWAVAVVKMADEQGVEIKSPHGIEKNVQKLRERKRKPKQKVWKNALATYKRNHATVLFGGVGGAKYDITKMSKEERAEKSWGPGPDMGSDVGSDDDLDGVLIMPG